MKRLAIIIFFLSTFLVFSVVDKSDFGMRLGVSLIHYSILIFSVFFLSSFYRMKFFFNKKLLRIFLVFLCLIIWLYAFSSTDYLYFVKILLNFFIGFSAYTIICNFNKISVNAIKLVLTLNLIVFFSQVIYYYLFSVYIDIHANLFPFSRVSYYYIELDKYVRFSGIHYEPGNFSIITAMFIVILNLIDKKKNYLLIIFSIFAIILTKSIAGIFLSIIIYVICFGFDEKRVMFNLNYKDIVLYGALTLSIIYFTGAYNYVYERLFDINSFKSFQQKNEVFFNLFERDFVSIFLGNGIENIENILQERTKGFVKDLGVGFNFIYSYGIFGIFTLLILFRSMNIEIFQKKMLIYTLLLVSKVDLLYSIFFIYVFVITDPLFMRKASFIKTNSNV